MTERPTSERLGAPETERGQAAGAFSISFDPGSGIGGVPAGIVADFPAGVPIAFRFAAAACALALAVARSLLASSPVGAERTTGVAGDLPPPRVDPGEAPRPGGS